MDFRGLVSGIVMGITIAVSPYLSSKADLDILYRIVEAEATECDYEQKKNVTYCILARVDDSGFPDSIEGVVFDKGQFSPISDKRYYSVEITEETKKAVNEALWSASEGHKCLYFCTDCKSYRSGFHSKLEEEFFDGVHHYFTGRRK